MSKIKGHILLFSALLFLNACSRALIDEVVYIPEPFAKDTTFQPREKAAEITNKTDSQLLEDGYVLIGKIKVHHDTEKTFPTSPTIRAKLEAAKKGGEFIKVEIDNERKTDTHFKLGACLETKRTMQIENVPEYETVCDYKGYNCYTRQKGTRTKTTWSETCIKYEQIPYKVTYNSTEALVYRYEPALMEKNKSVLLVSAARNGNKKTVKELLSGKLDINSKDANGDTALIAATSQKHIEIIKILLSKGADVNIQNNIGMTAAMLAASEGNADVLHVLLEKDKKFDINLELIEAARDGKFPIVKLLIERGANVNTKTDTGYTPLMAAAKAGDIEIVSLLIRRGADVNAKNIDGKTPLKEAAGNKEIIRILKNAGAKK